MALPDSWMTSVYCIRAQLLLRFNHIAGLCTKMAELLLQCVGRLLPAEWRLLSDWWRIQEWDTITAQRERYEVTCICGGVGEGEVFCDTIHISLYIYFLKTFDSIKFIHHNLRIKKSALTAHSVRCISFNEFKCCLGKEPLFVLRIVKTRT